MCKKFKQLGRDLNVYDSTNFITTFGVIHGVFGIKPSSGNVIANVRNEILRTTWKPYLCNRGILEVQGFYYKDHYFYYESGKEIIIPVIFNDFYDFVIVTCPAKKVVNSVTDREPIMISDVNEWLINQKFTLPNEKLIKNEIK